MKPPSISTLLLASALFTPSLHAQDAPAKVREIEQKVLLKQFQNAVQTLVASAGGGGETGASPELIGKRVAWLTTVSTQIKEGGHTAAAPREDLMSAGKLNELAWNMITSPDAVARHPDIALKLADIALELGGRNDELRPGILDTKARALFLSGKREEAIAEQEKAVAAAIWAKQRFEFEATLAAYRRNELSELHSEAAAAMDGVAYIAGKLNRIVIPRIDFEDTTVEESIDFLRLRAAQLDTTEPDPAKKGVNFVIRRPRAVPSGAADAGKLPTAPGAGGGSPDAAGDPGALRVKELRLRNVPLAVALKYICDQTKLFYKVDDFAVTLVPQSELDKEIFTRSFDVPPDFASILSSGPGAGEAPATGAAPTVRGPIIEALKSNGINFGEGSSVTLSPSGTLLVTNTPSELDKIEQLVFAATGMSEWTRKQITAPAGR